MNLHRKKLCFALALTGLCLTGIAVVPPTQPPVITSASVSGANFVLNVTNRSYLHGSYANSCVTLMSTNISLPLSQWVPVATNTFYSTNANFTIVVSNLVNVDVPQEFFTLRLTPE